MKLPHGVEVALSASFLRGSYAAMQSKALSPLLNHHPVRQVLHVKSLSQWAPLCIGPYSQANTVHHFLIYVAGKPLSFVSFIEANVLTKLFRANTAGSGDHDTAAMVDNNKHISVARRAGPGYLPGFLQ